MAIQVNLPELTNSSSRVGELFYEVKEFLKLNGWTVAGSSNGSAGGMDAVDRIVDETVISNTDRWIVLQSPHATPSDRIQILFGKSDSNNNNCLIAYCPEADYADNGTSIPTSATAITVQDASTFISVDGRLTMLVDDAAPYGWAFYVHPLLDVTGSAVCGAALIPLDVAIAVNNPGKPYVFYMSNGFNTFFSPTLLETADSTASPRCVSQGNNTTSSFSSSACEVFNGAGQLLPNGADQDASGNDISSPIVFQTAQYFFGTTQFMRWTGTLRNKLDTLSEGATLRARIVFGDVSFPWDGTTTPLP